MSKGLLVFGIASMVVGIIINEFEKIQQTAIVPFLILIGAMLALVGILLEVKKGRETGGLGK